MCSLRTSVPSTLTRLSALDETFGKSRVRRRGASLDSWTLDGHELPVAAERHGRRSRRTPGADALEQRRGTGIRQRAAQHGLRGRRRGRRGGGLPRRRGQLDADGIARAADLVLRRPGQRHADPRQRRAVHRDGLFELDLRDGAVRHDAGAGIGDADVAEIDEQRERVGPAHRVGDRLGRLDEDGVVVRRHADQLHGGRRGRHHHAGSQRHRRRRGDAAGRNEDPVRDHHFGSFGWSCVVIRGRRWRGRVWELHVA